MNIANRHVTRRKMLGAIGAGASIAALAACAPPTSAPATQAPAAATKQKITMKIGTATINDVQHEWAKLYKERLEKRTDGAISAEVYPASQLGSIPRMIEGVQLGTIESWMGPPDFVVGIEPRYMVPGMPLLFRDMDEMFKATSDNALMDQFLSLTEDKGIKGVSMLVYGPMIVYDRNPIRKPEDMRGRKYRVFASPPEIETMNGWGATAAPMALGEVVAALQQGTIDGAQTAQTVGVPFKFYDIVKWCTETNHSVITSLGTVSKVWYDKLPADVQKAIVEEGRAIQKDLFEWQKKELDKATQVWVEKTNNGLIKLNDQERKAFYDRLAPVRDKVLQQKPEIKETLEMWEAKVKEIRK